MRTTTLSLWHRSPRCSTLTRSTRQVDPTYWRSCAADSIHGLQDLRAQELLRPMALRPTEVQQGASQALLREVAVSELLASRRGSRQET